MPHRTKIDCIAEYYAHYGRLVAGEMKWLEVAYMTKTGAGRPAEIAEMIRVVKG
jgi:hypothetical protein